MNKSSCQKNFENILDNFRSERIFRGKQKKYFRLICHSDQGSMNRREKLFLGNIFKMLDLEIFGPSHSRYVTLKAELPLPSSC